MASCNSKLLVYYLSPPFLLLNHLQRSIQGLVLETAVIIPHSYFSCSVPCLWSRDCWTFHSTLPLLSSLQLGKEVVFTWHTCCFCLRCNNRTIPPILPGRKTPVFWKNVLSSSSTLNKKTACISAKPERFYQRTWSCISEGNNLSFEIWSSHDGE